MRPSLARATLLFVAFSVAACQSGNYVLVTLQSDAAIGGIASIELQLQQAGRMASSTVRPPAGASQISLPSTLTLSLSNASGTISITAIARAADGSVLAQGDTTVSAKAGGTANTTLTFHSAVVGGGTPMLAADHSAFDFGTVSVGQSSSAVRFTISNSGTGSSTALTASITGADAARFTISNDQCTAQPLAAAATCTASVTFSPNAAGSASATFTVADGAGASVSISLSANAVTPGALSISPMMKDLGAVVLGGTGSDATFTVTNTGGATSGVLATQLTGSDAADFAIALDGCAGMTLPAGGTCMLSVHAQPSATGTAGARAASLTVSGTPGGTAVAAVTATALTPGMLALTSTGGSFGTVPVGSSSGAVTYTFTNNGGAATGALQTTLTGTNSAEYSIVTDTCNGAVIGPAATCAVSVKASPTARGTRSATLTVAGTPGGTVPISLSVIGLDYVQLSVSISGTGTVTGGGINCTSGNTGTCTVQVARTTTIPTVTLTASGGTFTSWGGDCSGAAATCDVMMDVARSVTATFTVQTFALTVTKVGNGTVTSNPMGINCGPTCSFAYASGTNVTLTAVPAAGSFFAGWSSACSGFGPCTVTMSAAKSVSANFTTNVNTMFVTSTSYTIAQLQALGTGATPDAKMLSGADKACQNAATGAMLAGAYVAWLSTDTVAAVSRLNGARGWLRPDGKPFADAIPSAASPYQIFYPPNVDEQNMPLGNRFVWTGTDGAGNPMASQTCNNWSSSLSTDSGSVGDLAATSSVWSRAFGAACNSAQPVYCFGINYTVRVAPPPPSGTIKYAFLSQSMFTPNAGGLASADALCNADATAAGLPGSYKAILATTTASAASRFTATGATFVRPDHAIVGLDSAVLGGGTLSTSINVLPDGVTYDIGNFVYTGSASLTTSQSLGTGYTCGDWLNNSGTVGGISGNSTYIDSAGLSQSTTPCANPQPLYCLQN